MLGRSSLFPHDKRRCAERGSRKPKRATGSTQNPTHRGAAVAPKGNVMAYAWTETDPRPGSEEIIPLRGGSTFLVYAPGTKQAQTWNQYLAEQPR